MCDFRRPRSPQDLITDKASKKDETKSIYNENCNKSLGIQKLEIHNDCPIIEQLLSKAPQQVKRRQVEQHADLLGNLYNLGSGLRTVRYDEAAEAMLERTYPDLAAGKQNKTNLHS